MELQWVFALFTSCTLNFEDEILSIWKWFLLSDLKAERCLRCFIVSMCVCASKPKWKLWLYVCCDIIIFKTLSSPFAFSSSQIIWYSHRLGWKLWPFSIRFWLIYCIRETYGIVCMIFLKKPNPFMALIFRKKIKKEEVYSFN